MLIRQANQKSRIFVTDGIFQIKLNVCNGCHDLLMMSMKLSDTVILNIKGSDYHCIISGIRKSEAIKTQQEISI